MKTITNKKHLATSWRRRRSYITKRLRRILTPGISECSIRGQELCERRGGHLGLLLLTVLTSPYVFCGQKATLKKISALSAVLLLHLHLCFTPPVGGVLRMQKLRYPMLKFNQGKLEC